MSGTITSVRSPFDGHLVGEVPDTPASAVDPAVAAAKQAMKTPLPAWRRAEILDSAARLLADDRERFALIIAEESAKPLRTARTEVDRAVSTLQFSAVAARTLAGEMVPFGAAPSGEGKIGFTLRVPVGVIVGISPFNFPLNLVCHKVAPAIAAGAPILLKPSELTPLTAIAFHHLLVEQCGLPPAWFQLFTGSGAELGQALVAHPDVAMVSFTGSPEVGWAIRAAAPRKRVALELGNNTPVIIHADADWKLAAEKIRSAGFSHAGQSCISTQRILLHRSLLDAFTDALAAQVSTLVLGDPLNEQTEVSSLIAPKETVRVAQWVDEACRQGAQVAVGGQTVGSIYQPTVLRHVTPQMKVSVQEVFGPVVGITPYDDIDEAFALANATRYGLQVALWTNQLDLAMRAARLLDFGGILVNEVPTFRADNQPYGGVRDSGNTREGPAWTVRDMTEERLVVLPDPT
jgi:acyl-CoA reductase-like NAD-dependent aldehyde dehydrogenase